MNGSRVASLGQIGGMFADLLDTQLRLGLRIVETMMDGPARQMMDGTQRCSMPGTTSCCHIPPPCWVPVDLGTHTSRICPGMTASVRICVTNCGQRKRVITATVSGPDAGQVSITPTTLSLGPKERGCIHFTFAAAKPDDCSAREAILWVRGCKDYCLRWRVEKADRAECRCPEIEVDDCPDLIHHWYDHFYCRRPCPSRTSTGVSSGG